MSAHTHTPTFPRHFVTNELRAHGITRVATVEIEHDITGAPLLRIADIEWFRGESEIEGQIMLPADERGAEILRTALRMIEGRA